MCSIGGAVDVVWVELCADCVVQAARAMTANANRRGRIIGSKRETGACTMRPFSIRHQRALQLQRNLFDFTVAFDFETQGRLAVGSVQNKRALFDLRRHSVHEDQFISLAKTSL